MQCLNTTSAEGGAACTDGVIRPYLWIPSSGIDISPAQCFDRTLMLSSDEESLQGVLWHKINDSWPEDTERWAALWHCCGAGLKTHFLFLEMHHTISFLQLDMKGDDTLQQSYYIPEKKKMTKTISHWRMCGFVKRLQNTQSSKSNHRFEEL